MTPSVDLPPISALKEMTVHDLANFGVGPLDNLRNVQSKSILLQTNGVDTPTDAIRSETKFLIKLQAAGAQARLDQKPSDPGEITSLQGYVERALKALETFNTTGPGEYFRDRAEWTGKQIELYKLLRDFGGQFEPTIIEGLEQEYALNTALSKIFSAPTG